MGLSTWVRRISPASSAAATAAASGRRSCGTRAASPHCAGRNSCACTATKRRTTSGADASTGRAQPLHAEPELPQRPEVHRYCTSLRQVVAPPMSVATTPMASSTRPPCHHSSDSAAPTEAML